MESEKVEEKPPSETTPTIQPSEPAPTEEQKRENSGLTQDKKDTCKYYYLIIDNKINSNTKNF